VRCEQTSKEKVDKFRDAISKIVSFLVDIFSGAVFSLTQRLGSDKLPKEVQDMIRNNIEGASP
jgi:hypothetical protein